MTLAENARRSVSELFGRVRSVFHRKTLGKDAVAGLVLGVEAVPDGLAAGLLAGVNPIAGLYAYLFGMAGSALFASSTFMAVQATGAMSLIVSDTDLTSRPDPARALFTLSMLTGVFMIIAGLLKGGQLLRFVPTAVMVGFVTAVGVNIVLGQLTNLTGSDQTGANRVLRAFNILVHPGSIDWATLGIGLLTVALIVVLTRTRLKSVGLIVAVIVGSALAAGANALGAEVKVISDIAAVPSGLPGPVLPSLDDLLYLAVPALSLTFVGLVQGSAVSAGVPNPGRRQANSSQDFIGQGAGNIISGVFQGMPVGGSMSGSSLIVAAGAKTRLALFVAAAVMSLTILLASGLVSLVAMPSLAGLLIVIGFGAIKPARVRSVMKTGALQTTSMVVTFVLTLIVPLQFAVLAGVGLGIVLFVAQQSNRVRLRQIVFAADGRRREADPPEVISPEQVVVLQPYGSLFFASAPILEAQLPRIDSSTRRSVVIVRLRGVEQLGLSLVAVLRRYARALSDHDSRLVFVTTSEAVVEEMAAGGLIEEIGDDSVYRSTEWVGATTRRARAEAEAWVNRD